jgi:predicted metal-dependent hydrolase
VVTGIPEGGGATGLPSFTLRVSKRARHVRLVVTGEGELVVVVPRRFDRRAIPAILESKVRWIERARARAKARRLVAEATEAAADELPVRIVLPALDEEWEVEYRTAVAGAGRQARGSAVAREAPGGRLVVTGPAGDKEASRRALIEWLRRRARSFLVPRLEELARRDGMGFGRVTVRHQTTRWASCSPQGAISLNLRLLFLEPALLDHVLIHELCHTKELNHSKRFWALVQARDPAYALHRRQVRHAWRSLPAWVRPEKASLEV